MWKEMDNCDKYLVHLPMSTCDPNSLGEDNMLNGLPCVEYGSLVLSAVIIQVLVSNISHWFNLVRFPNEGGKPV